jgi:hypothetical protein
MTVSGESKQLLNCPECGCQFELSALMRQHLEAELRQKLYREYAGKEAGLLRRLRELEEREQQVAIDIEKKLADETARIRQQEAKAARERASREADERIRRSDEELEAMRKKLADANRRDIEISRRTREIDAREQELELAMERKITEERLKMREQVSRLSDERLQAEREQYRLREEEHKQRAEVLQRTVHELQHKLAQGSQQTQGEAQEIALRDLLVEAFPFDDVEDVPRGVHGADVIQRVRSADGHDCDSIIWESKRTRAWSDGWLAKLRDDQRETRAALAVIVTQVLPREVRHFAFVDGVWVCAWPYAAALAAVLRDGMIELARARRAAEGRGEKMHMLYAYLTGPEFKNRVVGLLESVTDMKDDLERERIATLTRWKRREKQIARALENMTALCGDLQGIAGAKLASSNLLELEPGTTDDAAAPAQEDDDEPVAARPEEAGLVELLLELVPADGASVTNAALYEQFVRVALERYRVRVDDADFARCKDALLASGRVRRGKGRGGSLARVAADNQGVLLA